MKFIGIDPGASGGIAVIHSEGCYAHKMPDTLKDIYDLLADIAKGEGAVHAVIEQVHSMPGQGVSSSFKFGEGYGALQMALIAAGIPFSRVSPVKWQTVMACRTGGQKNISKARAQELFPHIKATHAIADALLIAEYARRTHQI